MNKELEFAQTLEEVKQLARRQQNVISKEQITESFAAIGIKEEQLEPVFQYLNTKNIGIGEPIDTRERLTGEEKDYLAEYEETMKDLVPLTDGEKRAYTMAAMSGDKDKLSES